MLSPSLPEGVHDGFLDSRWVCCEHFAVNISWVHDKVHVKSPDFLKHSAKAAKCMETFFQIGSCPESLA